MFKKKLNEALGIIIAASLLLGCMTTDIWAVGRASEVPGAIDVTTGTQDDARADETENRENNPSEYDRVESSSGDDNDAAESDDAAEQEEDAAEEEIIWIDVHIKSEEDLQKLAKNCRLDTYSADKKVYLDADISLLGEDFDGIPYFNGYFYGQNHTISNFMINDTRSYQGFFSRLDSDAIVSGLNVQGRVTPTGAQTIVGGIAGDNKGIISGCSFDGLVSGEDYVGGLTGINELSGIIIDCTTSGIVSGTHFTGGITGENMGNIIQCTNRSGVNITNKDSAVSVEDISVDNILATVGIGDVDKDEAEASAMINGVVDMGGIAGISIGVIQFCDNQGDVGYTNVGYNVGGIAGRQSGYIYSCANSGHIMGRKDVGGIVGQAEPYVTIDFANDITSQLSDNIAKLHDILTVTLNDADGSSDAISARLAVIKTFADQALTDTRFIENETIDWTNGIVASANEALSRIDFIMDEAAKKDGVMDKTSDAAGNAKTAMGQFDTAISHIDIYGYLSESEAAEYDAAKTTLADAVSEHAGYVDEVYERMYRFYIDTHKYDAEFSETGDGKVNENNLSFKSSDGTYVIGDKEHNSKIGPQGTTYEDSVYSTEGHWVHRGAGEGDSDVTFPGGSEEQAKLDRKLTSKAAAEANTSAGIYADEKYAANHSGHSYSTDVSEATETISTLTLKYSDQMSADTKRDAQKAVDSLKKSMGDLQDAGDQAKSIITTLNDKGDITLPSLSAEYKAHANSLTNNIQGMSDNFGLLNSEMNGASDKLINNLHGVNDQFNVIMQLFTDAIDGVLDNDYSNTYTDNSLEVCRTTTDATVDSCTNAGAVEGSINVSGICGTMAIEYDFDLESDITGVRDAALNKSYQTKCVLRDDINNGKVTAQKNYAGGVCGLQELGTIVGGQNYNTICSSTASYVGGIAGSSVSSIVNGYSKCSLQGKSYVGGIVGDGTRIYDSFAMVKIDDAGEWYGAIAGHVATDADIVNNFFVSEDLSGIDRVSYKGMAEPVSYSYVEETIGDVPSDFSKIFVMYMLDEDPDSEDDELVLLQRLPYSYGENIDEEKYPQVPEKEGYYVEWDIPCIDGISNDEIVTASYVRCNSTLAGDILRLSGQSAILVDGGFRKEDVLGAVLQVQAPDALPDSREYWEIVIPDDGQASHMVRYMKADTMEDWPDIYIYRDASWELIETEDINKMGSYETFMVDGDNVKLQMVYSDAKKNKIRNILTVIGIIVGAAAMMLLIILAVKSRKRVHRKVKKKAQAIREKAEAREPAIKFVEESDFEDALDDDQSISDGSEKVLGKPNGGSVND